ncbi:MAG TPA: hypothetical protein VM684_10430 [Gaiellales bacterium]|jgi:hypothetical protein|nr:hypothetical protein [Gaiellales bacterium]HVI36634.1 hypothetical protein [Gaiellales bacterium]
MSDTGAQGPERGGEQEMRMPTVPELVLSTAQLAISLAADEIARKGDLEQAQLAIDTADALMPLVARLLPPEHLPQYRRALSELQLAYAEATAPASGPAAGREPEAAKDTQPPTVETPPRPPIWTPGGDV